jgi:hypothetical protein
MDGYASGAARCKDYATDPPLITEIGFTSSGDAAREGDMPFTEILKLARRDLNAYWKKLAGRSPVSEVIERVSKARECVRRDTRPIVACSSGVVAYDRGALQSVYDRYGDKAVATPMAEAWADAARSRGDVRVADAPERRDAECLAGAWTGDVVSGRRGTDVTLSSGDLDEVVATLLAFLGRPTQTNGAFVRFKAFRTGFDGGATACGLDQRN